MMPPFPKQIPWFELNKLLNTVAETMRPKSYQQRIRV